MFRFGEKHDLLFALPPPSRYYFGGGLYPLQADMINSVADNRLGFNVLAVHAKWNQSEVRHGHKLGSIQLFLVSITSLKSLEDESSKVGAPLNFGTCAHAPVPPATMPTSVAPII